MRSITDLQALAMRELAGDERPGTVVSELTGSAIPETANDAVSALLKLAEKLGAPATTQKSIKEFVAASEKARAESAALNKLRTDTEIDLANAHAEHQATLARELRDHQKALADGRAEVDAMRKEAAKLLAQAKVEAASAEKLKTTWERRMKAFDSAA